MAVTASLAVGGQGPPVEPLMGDPMAHRFQVQLSAGQWEEFQDFLDSTHDWADRHFYVYVLAQSQSQMPWLQEWAAARPKSALPLLFRGACGIHWAWQVRGSTVNARVRPDVWPKVRELLTTADEDLARAAELDPADPTPHARRIRTAIGLTRSLHEISRCFDSAVRLDPWNYAAHQEMLQALAPKWYGSAERMLEFARSISTAAPPGLPVHTVLAMAHIESWIQARSEPHGRRRQLRYFDDEAVRTDVRLAARLSIDSEHYVTHKGTPADRNLFAMCYWLMRDFQSTLDQMRLIGPLVQRVPWMYHLGDASRAYEEARRMALRKARRLS